MKIKILTLLLLTILTTVGQNKKTTTNIDQQVISYLNKFEKLDKHQQRIAANKLVVFLNSTDEKTKGLWLSALEKYDKSSSKKTKKSEEDTTESLKPNSFQISTFSKIPPDLAGCSFIFSANKQNLKSNKYVYFDDMGTTAIIAINGESVVLKKHSNFTEKEDEITVYSNAIYTAYVHLKKYLGDSENESQIYTAELVVKDANGNVVKLKIYGEGGC